MSARDLFDLECLAAFVGLPVLFLLILVALVSLGVLPDGRYEE